ncbi:hypothetical protein BH11BAC4_BH11BAC4_02700 [soil metagenome]
MESIKNLFGFGPKTDYHGLVRDGSVIVGVRSKAEFESEHIHRSIKIPVDQLRNSLNN